MRILVTNDDGVDSVGIQLLARALHADSRFDVSVVAPDRDYSGVGASLGGARPDDLRGRAVELPEAPGVEAWAVNAPPAMCVLAGRLEGFGDPPDVVVSGINAGLNTGRAILHSGTVGAALTAQNFGLSALAVSLQEGEQWRWDTAVRVAMDVMDLLLDAPARSVLNLNVPNCDYADVAGTRWARLAPFGEVRMALTPRDAPATTGSGTERSLVAELQLTEVDFDPDTDTGLVRSGFAALTTLVGVAEAWPDATAPTAEAIEQQLVPGASLDPAHRVPDANTQGTLRRPQIG